ncbi:hypothetical protein ACIBVL_41280 [Streptomyces sp. NPDC049687]|uniref:hypothetical protein n=1 Tax=Streptomyces sp. NPDC049687 TaxID=3365596 RepID=UPI003791ED81
MNQQGEQRLDQIVFRWEGNRGRPGTGITAVAYSCERARAEELREELAPLLQTEGTGQPSQVRHVRPRDGEVVVINRRRGPDAHGRASTESHALIGSRDVLKARLCLTLGQLPLPVAAQGLSGADPARCLGIVEFGDLQNAAEPEWQRFTARVETVREPLAVVAAQLLRTPDHLMSLRIPEFSAEDTNDTALLIWGLCGMFGNWLGRDFWTYATYDTTDSHALRVMGVPHWRTSAVEDLRLERIALRSAPDDEAQRVAAELVRRFLSEPIEAAGVRRVLSRCPAGAALPTRDRLRILARLLETPRVQPGGTDRTGGTDGRAASAAPLAAADPRPLAPEGRPETTGAGATRAGGPGAGDEAPAVDRSPERPTGRPLHPSGAPASHTPVPGPLPAAQEGSAHGASPAGPRPHPQHLVSEPPLPPAPPLLHHHAHPAHSTGDEPTQDRGRDPSPNLPLAPLRPLPQSHPRGRGAVRAPLLARGHPRRGPAGDLDTEPPDDEVLLARLRDQDLPRKEVDRLLEALADGARRRTLRQAQYLGRQLLRQRLFLRRGRSAGRGTGDGRDARGVAETAFWLLHWAVLPYVDHPDIASYVVRLIRDACGEDGPVERRFLRLIAYVPAYGVPKLPSEAWWDLMQYLGRGVVEPLPEADPRPQARRADHRLPRAETAQALPSDDRWRVFFLAMTCVAALLFLVLMLVLLW